MTLKNTGILVTLYLSLCGYGRSKSADMSAFNRPNAGPPATYFAAADSVPASVLQAAAAAASVVPKDAIYLFSLENSEKSIIHSDWLSFKEGAALSWVADMDVDCDGVNHKCDGNGDGQPQTNWGALSAYAVPYIVIPDMFLAANKDILPGNNVAAVICGGKMFYGVLGDSNGDNPQITGEASWLMARTCFPKEDLQGNNAHSPKDVTYILFTGKEAVLPDTAINKNYITDFDTLRSMGDKFARALASNLATPTTVSTATATTTAGDSAAAMSRVGQEGRMMMIALMVWAVMVTITL
ncbi:glycoside hydrolase family 75 protein [Aspergillus alliaceus]|nr:fungal chitosanase of glycosyl hydrolase group 75-domain-containing protein [Aspergillus alliaceus]KAB8228237.1 fungal chitosanase of glycosyl hydrolase group 75-domain-containing protein [Aspergillus alliaceus]